MIVHGLSDIYGEKPHSVSISVPKIYEILKEKLVIKSKWKKNQARGPVPVASHPQEVVQMDSIDFGGLFAFTGIDIYTREADIFLAPELTAHYGYQFLTRSMYRRFHGHVNLLQTDGGSEFKEEFKCHVYEYCDRHRVARPYKKNEQSYIESFNRTVRKECLGWIKYREDQLTLCTNLVEVFLDRYHYHRPHMGIGMKPPLQRS
jgi:putative transposase